MTWSTPKDLKNQLIRLWARGELLRETVTDDPRFPLRLTLKGPDSSDITEHFEAVRSWVTELTEATPLRLEWVEVRHRVQGSQRLPSAAWVDSLADALNWLGKQRDGKRFSQLLELTRQQCPDLLPWLAKRPLQALELEGEWRRILAVVGWLRQHPLPAIYLRQVDIPDVPSKFIETHRAVLAECLDLALPAESIRHSHTGVSQFAARYGFLEKPTRIRWRILDADNRTMGGLCCPDITLDARSFSQLTLDIGQVLITENETNFLALPNIPRTIAIFGSGYGWDALAQARWLNHCTIHYWGDIDTHGFAILNQLRHHFSHVTSFLMDRTTLDAHTSFWGREDKPLHAELQRLTTDERSLYEDLRDNPLRQGLRLEQEHIGFGWVSQGINCLNAKVLTARPL